MEIQCYIIQLAQRRWHRDFEVIYTIFGKGIVLATSTFIEIHYEDTLCANEHLCRKVSQFSIRGGETIMYVFTMFYNCDFIDCESTSRSFQQGEGTFSEYCENYCKISLMPSIPSVYRAWQSRGGGMRNCWFTRRPGRLQLTSPMRKVRGKNE